MPAFINLTGRIFGRLTVIKRGQGYRAPSGKVVTMWDCQCSCGNLVTTHSNSLRFDRTKSCGCLNDETRSRLIRERSTTHGETAFGQPSREYATWSGLKGRCLNPNNFKYPIYGGRGIKVCERWLQSFDNFLIDMGRRPHPKMQIDRINNDGNYEPGNCRWAFPITQANNRSVNKYLEYKGERLTIRDWSNKTGICYGTIASRLNYGWSIEKVLMHPKRSWGGRAKKRTDDSEVNPNSVV